MKLAAHFAFAATLTAQPSVLDRWAGRDLRMMSATEKRELESALPHPGKISAFEPWLTDLWTIGTGPRRRYVALFQEPLIVIPGGSALAVELLDGQGQRISGWAFQAGWRLAVTGISFGPATDFVGHMLIVETKPSVTSQTLTKQYYLLRDDQLIFIRAEGNKGHAAFLQYAYHAYEVGFPPPGATVEEWRGLLTSNDRALTLSALLFLGANHICVRLMCDQRSKHVDLFRTLIADPIIQAQITGLAQSGDTWIREAALLAARDPVDRPAQDENDDPVQLE